jgi:uncharacterized membrane protein
MKSKKAILLMWIVSLLPFVLVAIAWPHLPERIPGHWGLNGQIDRYDAPATLWLMCAVGPLLSLGFQFLPRLDPKRENYEKFQPYYDFFGPLVPFLLLLCIAVTLSESLWPGQINVARAIGLMVGVLFLIIGNIMGKVKTNWFMGFRTPWALSDPDVWNKTQRLGGWTFFLSGLSAVILSLLAPVQVFFAVFFAILFLGIALTYFMSWKWFKDKERQHD